MAPNPKRKRSKNPSPTSDSGGIFTGMIVFMVDSGAQTRRLQIWKQKLGQMGASIEDHFSGRVTHVFAVNWSALKQKFGDDRLANFKGIILLYQWLEDSLRAGERLPEDSYVVKEDLVEDKSAVQSSSALSAESNRQNLHSDSSQKPTSSGLSASSSANSGDTAKSDATDQGTTSSKDYNEVSASEVYNPPDLNRNVTDIFKRMVDIYRALGDDRRCFSYYKAISVVEKLPFKIESSDQIKHLPAIGKSLQDHIMEIVTTGKFSKLEHFEQDEKVRTISPFGEVWGFGPATALKLYGKGRRSLKDLESDESLTKAQRLGLKYFDGIKTRIPRHEVAEMEKLLREVAESVLTGPQRFYGKICAKVEGD